MPLAYGVPIPLHALPPPPSPSSSSTSTSQRPPTRYAIHIRIPVDVIEAIQNEPPLGQPMTVQLGDAPILQTPSQSFNLTSSSESAPHEVYRLATPSANAPSSSSSSSSYHPSTELARSALIVSKLRVRKDLDSATLDRLKASEEAERKIKTARSTVMIDSPAAAAAASAKSKAAASAKLRKTSSTQVPVKVVAGPSTLAKPPMTARPPSRLVLKPMPVKPHSQTAPIAQSPLQASFRPPSPSPPPPSRALSATLEDCEEDCEDGEVREDPKELAAGPSRTATLNSILMQSGPHRAESIASSESSRSPGSNILGGSSGASDTSRTTVDSLPSFIGTQVKDEPPPLGRKPSTPHSPSGSSTGASAAGSAPTVSKKPGGGGIMKGKESMKKDKAKAGKSKAAGSSASTSSQASATSTSRIPSGAGAGAAEDSVAEDSDAPSTPVVPPRRRPGIASRVRTASSQLKQTTTSDMAQPIGQTKTDADKIFAASIVKPAQSPSASSSSTVRATDPTPPSASSSILHSSERPQHLPARPSTIIPPTLPKSNPIPNPRPASGGAPRANGVTSGGTKVYRPVKKPAPVTAVAPSPAIAAVEKEPAKTASTVEVTTVTATVAKDNGKGKKRSWEETEVAAPSAIKGAGKTSTVKSAPNGSASGSGSRNTTTKGETEAASRRKKFKAEFSSDEEGDADVLTAVMRKAARDGAHSVPRKAESAEDSLARLKAKVRRRDEDRARDEARRKELNREEGEMSEAGEIRPASVGRAKGKRGREDREQSDVEAPTRRDEAAKSGFVSDLVGLKVRKKHKVDHEDAVPTPLSNERISRVAAPYAALDRHGSRDRSRNASPPRRPPRSPSPRRRSPSLDNNRAPFSRPRPSAPTEAPPSTIRSNDEPLGTLADAKAARSRFLMLHNDHMLTRQRLTSMIENVGSSMEKVDVSKLGRLVDSVMVEHEELGRLRGALWAYADREAANRVGR